MFTIKQKQKTTKTKTNKTIQITNLKHCNSLRQQFSSSKTKQNKIKQFYSQ